MTAHLGLPNNLELTHTNNLTTFNTTGPSTPIPPIVFRPSNVTLPVRVYRVVLARGVQEIICTNVCTDEGFLKFYNHLPTPTSSSCSVVAMIPSASVQLVTSTLLEDMVVV